MLSHQNMQNIGGQGGSLPPMTTGYSDSTKSGANYPYQRPMLSNQMQRQQQMGYPEPPDGPQIPARIFCRESNIRPNEVPSDGTLSAFIKEDCSCVYLKQVNQRGLIDELKYVPERKESPAPTENAQIASVDFSPIMERLEKIEGYLSHSRSNYRKPRPKQQNGAVQVEKTENE